MSIAMGPADWLDLFRQFALLSLMAVGGAITTAPDMHRYLVTQQHWLGEAQFSSSIALSQAAPGPNVLFVALLGWNIGLNAAGGSTAAGAAPWAMALFGALLTLVAIMLPSAVLTYTATQWGHRNRNLRPVRAFKTGMAPIVIALLVATGWLLIAAHDQPARDWRLWLLAAASALLVWRTRIHLLWIIGAGAVLGALGWV